MDKILFIINPVAGGGKAKALISLIKEKMDKHKKEYEIILTKGPKEAIGLAEEKCDDFEVIVAVGGDGTVNEVSRGLINKGKGTLGIIPGGTGNDLAKSLGIPKEPSEALELLCKGNTKLIDIGKANRYNFLNIGSIGFDADVVINNINLKKIIKSGFSYVISVIYTLLHYRSKKVEIIIDDNKIKEDILLLAVGNGKYYGGGLPILPQTIVDDGLLDICIVSNINKLKFLLLFPSIFKGKHIKYDKYVKLYRGKDVKVISREEVNLNIDGEIIPNVKEVFFSMESKKLKVIC